MAPVELEDFEVFVTTDKNIVSQQNLDGLPCAVVVPSSTSRPRIRTAADTVKLVIDAATPGTVTEVTIP